MLRFFVLAIFSLFIATALPAAQMAPASSHSSKVETSSKSSVTQKIRSLRKAKKAIKEDFKSNIFLNLSYGASFLVILLSLMSIALGVTSWGLIILILGLLFIDFLLLILGIIKFVQDRKANP